MKVQIIPRVLHFRQPAGTSRGVYTTRRVWYVVVSDPETGRMGVGECAPLPSLSCDDLPDYGERLAFFCREALARGGVDQESLRDYPSMLFGLETAFRHLGRGRLALADTPFSRGEAGIPINGLIWMGRADEMLARINEKMERGFRCIKVKIGAIGFEEECALLSHIRERFSPDEVELRVDANGAFSPEEAPGRLKTLSAFGLHSIEQPIRAGQWERMAALCASSPLPVALDEELIGVNRRPEKIALLERIQPAYIILKPSLHGGIAGCEEWISLARERGIRGWVTSALESNIGLNAIAHWCSTLSPVLPQGLGTGALFTDNIGVPLGIEGDCLWYRPGSGENSERELLENFLFSSGNGDCV